jgi:O-antigen ligase
MLIVSLIYTDNFARGLFIIEKSASLLIFPLVFSTINNAKPARVVKTTLNLFVVVIILLIVYIEYSVISTIISKGQGVKYIFSLSNSHKELAGLVGLHPTYLGMYVNFSLIICYASIRSKRYNNIILLLISIVLFFFLFQLGSRMQLIISYVILFLSVFTIWNKAAHKLILICSFIIINIIVISIFWESSIRYRFEQIVGYKYETGYVNDSNHKLKLWSAALDANTSFLFGVGPGDSQEARISSYKRNGLALEYKKQYNAHNQFIDIFINLGIIGVLIFLYICISLIKKYIELHDYIAILFMMIFLLSCMTESILARREGIVFFTFFASLLAFSRNK